MSFFHQEQENATSNKLPVHSGEQDAKSNVELQFGKATFDGSAEGNAQAANEAYKNGSTYKENLAQDVITTTKERLRSHFREHLSICEGKNSWQAPFTVVLTILVTLNSANFKQFIFAPATWHIIFVAGLLISIYFLGVGFFRSYEAHNKGSLDKLMNKIWEEKG